MFPDATEAGTSCTFGYFHNDAGDRGEKWLCLVESEGDGKDGGDSRATGKTVEIGWERKLVTGSPGGRK